MLEKQVCTRHACESETSVMLYLYPELVDMNVAKDFDISMDIFMPYLEHKVDEPIDGYIGNVGYSTLATREKGKVIYEKNDDKIRKCYKKKIENLNFERRNLLDNKLIGNENNIIFYNDEEGQTRIEVILQNENVWLNIDSLTKLFKIDRTGITRHIKNIYKDKELDKESTCAKIAHMGNDNKQQYSTSYYNLDMIISIGFRVNSKPAIKFRTWANAIIKDYMIQGFALDDNRFMKGRKSDQEYFKRLLERIKLIRTSERMFYQKITDIFAECSIDYDNTSETAREFYASIQNKFHYAITGETAAEIIYNRVDNNKPNMGLTNWKESPDGKILKSDVIIAKNYLSEMELKNLNNIVNIFLDIAEDNAERNIPMYMKDWKEEVDNVLKMRHYKILDGKGKISKLDADTKASKEYEKFKVKQDKNYISDFDKLTMKSKKINNKK